MRLDGHKLLQVWQWGPGVQSERTVADLIQVCREYGFTGVVVKALDGTTWMGAIDPTPSAIGSVAAARRQGEELHAAGLFYGVWTNPLDADLAEQARLTASLGSAPEIDAVFLDAEPYAHFWGAWRPAGRAREFMERVRSEAPGACLVLQPDPRPGRLAELRPDEWIPYVAALAGQHYFNTFQVDPAEEMARAVALGQQWSLPVYPTVPGSAPVDELQAAMQVLVDRGVRGCIMWRLGVAGAGQLAAIGGTSFGPAPSPAVPDPMLEGADPRSKTRLVEDSTWRGELPLRFTEAQALAYLQSRGHEVIPTNAIGLAAVTAFRLGLPYLNPGPAVEGEHEETLDGQPWMVQRFANVTIKWSSQTGVALHPVNLL